jgi:hypothetical protein
MQPEDVPCRGDKGTAILSKGVYILPADSVRKCAVVTSVLINDFI